MEWIYRICGVEISPPTLLILTLSNKCPIIFVMCNYGELIPNKYIDNFN